MKKLITLVVLTAFVVGMVGCIHISSTKGSSSCPMGGGCSKCSANKNLMRFGMVVGIDPDVIDEYKRLHADSNPGVRDLLTKYNMQNFTIYLQEIDGKWYEFGYYEYVGDDFDGDMAKLDAEPRNKAWLEVCDPMQIPLPGSKGWTIMEQVYHND